VWGDWGAQLPSPNELSLAAWMDRALPELAVGASVAMDPGPSGAHEGNISYNSAHNIRRATLMRALVTDSLTMDRLLSAAGLPGGFAVLMDMLQVSDPLDSDT
jgi:hypothetical protein